MELTPALASHLTKAQSHLTHLPAFMNSTAPASQAPVKQRQSCWPAGKHLFSRETSPPCGCVTPARKCATIFPLRGGYAAASPAGRLISRQAKYICIDPYANAFNENPDNSRWDEDETVLTPWTWERKYETDSLCYPVWLAWSYWQATGRTQVFTPQWREAAYKILDILRTEQSHREQSPYRFIRPWAVEQGNARETLQNNGLGTPIGYTGMTWSGFRPSDDACEYHYLIPANCFAAVILGELAAIAREAWQDEAFALEALRVRREIVQGIEAYRHCPPPTLWQDICL